MGRKYKLTQNVFSWGHDYTIKDDSDRVIYNVDGKKFSVADRLSIYDGSGKEVAAIARNIPSEDASYDIFISGNYYAKVSTQLLSVDTRINIDVPGPNDYKVTGDLFSWDFVFTCHDYEVARVFKQLDLTDSYILDIIDSNDDLVLLSTVIVIDLIYHRE